MKNTTNLKIIFLGTPEFGAIILKKLIKHIPSFVLSPYMSSFSLSLHGPFQPVFVITAPDKPVGRKKILTPPPVKILAEKYNIPVLQPEKIKNYKFTIEGYEPDLIVIAAYNQILPKEILEIPKYGSLNLHPSLLPRWRGPSPVQHTILAGDKNAGVTIILMDEQTDHGPILAQRELGASISLNPKETPKKITFQSSNESISPLAEITRVELNKKLTELGAELLVETIPKWIKGKIKPQAQDESKATFSKILKREDGKIDWKKPAIEIERQIRAFESWPESFCLFCKRKNWLRLKILKANVLKQTSKGPFGSPGKTFLAPDDKIAVQTGKNFLIITELQLEGKKPITSKDFLKGRADFIGVILE